MKTIYPTYRDAETKRRQCLEALRSQGHRRPLLRVYRTGGGWALTSRPEKRRKHYKRVRFIWAV